MPLQFDTSKKAENALVLEKHVPLRIAGKNYVYLMTNNFSVIVEKLKSFQCRIPEPEDFKENSALAKNVRAKMTALGATWSLTITLELAVLNYYDPNSGIPYLVSLEKLTTDGKISSIVSLFHYTRKNETEKIKALVKSGYDVDQCVQDGITPLMSACESDSCDSVKTLLELGADINASDANGQTPLMYTTFNNSVNSAKLLLARKDIKLEEKDITGSTALLRAVESGSNEILEYIIKAGADVNTVNYSHYSALAFGVLKGNRTATNLLIKYGANVNYTDKMNRTPMIIAAQQNDSYIVKSLVQSGADINAKDINQSTAFLVAAENNSASVIEFLTDTQEIPEEEYTKAVIKSAMKGHVNTTNTLLKKSKNQKQMSFAALISACLKNNADIIHICMNYGCNINDTLYFGMTPLMIACYVNADKAAAQLITYNAELDKKDEFGMTALMYAAVKNNLVLIALLLRNEADKQLTDNSDKTFEDYTEQYDTRSFYQLIIDRMKSMVQQTEAERKDNICSEHLSFGENFRHYHQYYFERFPNRKDSDIYHSAGIQRQNYSKIISKINSGGNSGFRPHKNNVIALAVGLNLTLNETKDLLQSAGYILENSDKTDIEIKKLLDEKNYNLFTWNDKIYAATGKVFFTSIIEDEMDSKISH